MNATLEIADLATPMTMFLIVASPFVGSFLGLVVDRFPGEQGLLVGRSACSHCGHRLGMRDLVPLFSWLLVRGRCRYCAAWLGWKYPLIELLALGVAVWSVAVMPDWMAWVACGLGWTLVALSAIDARHLILPDALTLPLVVAGLVMIWIVDPGRVLDHAIGAGLGFAVFAGLGAVYRKVRDRDGLGLGDAKLMAAAGAWVSWEGLPSVVLLGAGSGLAVALARRRGKKPPLSGKEIPFGPYIAAGFWIVWMYGPLRFG